MGTVKLRPFGYGADTVGVSRSLGARWSEGKLRLLNTPIGMEERGGRGY